MVPTQTEYPRRIVVRREMKIAPVDAGERRRSWERRHPAEMQTPVSPRSPELRTAVSGRSHIHLPTVLAAEISFAADEVGFLIRQAACCRFLYDAAIAILSVSRQSDDLVQTHSRKCGVVDIGSDALPYSAASPMRR
jgi:hypothetical protein